MKMILDLLISIFGEQNLCISIFLMAIVFVISVLVYTYETIFDKHPNRKKIANIVNYVSSIYVLLMVALIFIVH